MLRSFDTPINSNDHSIDRVFAAGLPVLLVFLNGPASLSLRNTLERLAKAHAGSLLVVQVQGKENPATMQRFGMRGMPAVAAVKNGQISSKAENITPSDLEQHAAYLLGKGPRPAEQQATNGGGASRAGAQQAGAAGGTPYRSGANAAGQPVNVTDATFNQEVLGSSQPVLVDFWAPWCGPCRMTEPVLQKLAREMAGQLKIAKVNVDENPYVAQQYGVQSIPTMMVVRGGKVIDRWVGASNEAGLRSRLAGALR